MFCYAFALQGWTGEALGCMTFKGTWFSLGSHMARSLASLVIELISRNVR